MAEFDGRLVLYPERMFQPRGEVWDWAEDVTEYFVYWSAREAPARTGELAAGISGDVDNVGPTELSMNIYASATNPHTGEDYVSFVLFGTDAQDVDPPGVMMHNDGASRGDYFFDYNKTGERNWIYGQEPNNFFARARWHVQGRYRSIGYWSGIEG